MNNPAQRSRDLRTGLYDYFLGPFWDSFIVPIIAAAAVATVPTTFKITVTDISYSSIYYIFLLMIQVCGLLFPSDVLPLR